MIHSDWMRNDRETGVVICLAVPNCPIYRLGWGFDSDLPLRPWMADAVTRTPNKDLLDVCVSWLGLYMGVTVPPEGASVHDSWLLIAERCERMADDIKADLAKLRVGEEGA